MTTYAEALTHPVKHHVWYIRIFDEDGIAYREYSTAPLWSENVATIIPEYFALIRNPRLTSSSIELPSGKTKLPSFNCDLIDRIVGAQGYSQVSKDLLGQRTFDAKPRLQIIGRRIQVYHGFDGLDRLEYQKKFDGSVASFKQVSPGMFKLKCDSALALLDVSIFRHIKFGTTIAVDGTTIKMEADDLDLPVASSTAFKDPEDVNYPFSTYCYVTREDGSQTTHYQYMAKSNTIRPGGVNSLVIGTAGDSIYGGAMLATQQQGTGVFWELGDEVWEAMFFQMSPIEFALWMLLTTATGTNHGLYDKGVEGFGAEIEASRVAVTEIETLLDDFKFHQFGFYRTVKEMREEPVNCFQFLKDEICDPLGLIITTNNRGQITLREITGGLLSDEITDHDLIQPPTEEFDDRNVTGEIQFFTDPSVHDDSVGEFRHKWIHGYTGTAEAFPKSIDKRLQLQSRSVHDDLYTHNQTQHLTEPVTEQEVGNSGFTYWSYYNTVFPHFSEPFAMVDAETHWTKSGLIPGDQTLLSASHLHKLGQFDEGGRGIQSEAVIILEQRLKPNSVTHKLWRPNAGRWLDQSTSTEFEFAPDDNALVIPNVVATANNAIGPRANSVIVGVDDAFLLNTNKTGQFLQLEVQFTASALTRTHTDLYPLLGLVVQVGDYFTTPVTYINVVASYIFDIQWNPPTSGTEVKIFQPRFVLPDDTRAYDIVLKFWRHNFLEPADISDGVQLNFAAWWNIDYTSPV